VMPVALGGRPQNLVPASREMSATREETERRSLRQSGRKGSRPKLTRSKPDLLRSSSMPNVMAKSGKQRRQRSSPRTVNQASMPNVMVTPARKPTSRQSLHGVFERTSKLDSEPPKRRSNIERASSAQDVTASTRNQKSRRALVMEKKQTSERASRKSVDDTQILQKKLVKADTKVRLQGLNAHPALNGQTVTIAKFLEDGSRNRVKPRIVEVAGAKSTKAVSMRIVPTTTHNTRRPGMPQKTPSQRSVVQNRKSGPRSGNVTSTPSRALSSEAKRPAYQTSKSESFLGVMT
jgi:hypothetical protein